MWAAALPVEGRLWRPRLSNSGDTRGGSQPAKVGITAAAERTAIVDHRPSTDACNDMSRSCQDWATPGANRLPTVSRCVSAKLDIRSSFWPTRMVGWLPVTHVNGCMVGLFNMLRDLARDKCLTHCQGLPVCVGRSVGGC